MGWREEKGLGEQRVKDIFDQAGLTSFFRPNTFGLHTEVYGLSFITEVWVDPKATKSGQIGIPVSSLTSIQASLWAHVLEDSVWLTTISQLKTFVHEVKPDVTFTQGWQNNIKVFLYPDFLILPRIFHRIDNSNPLKLRKLVCQMLK